MGKHFLLGANKQKKSPFLVKLLATRMGEEWHGLVVRARLTDAGRHGFVPGPGTLRMTWRN